MSGKSNIERVLENTAEDTLRTWRRAGAEASNRAQAMKKSVNEKLNQMLSEKNVPDLLSGMLLGSLPEDERKYVRALVPPEIPDEAISPLVAMLYSSVGRIIKTGNASDFTKLMQLAGLSAELSVKLRVEETDLGMLDLTQMSDREIMKMIRECRSKNVVDAEGFEDLDEK